MIGRFGSAVLSLTLLACLGCGMPTVDTTYGRSFSSSINGTGAFLRLFREAGHEVRPAFRLTDELSDWADVIVRFASKPGPISKDEADWYDSWFENGTDRRLIYIPRDYDASSEYWTRALAGLPKTATPRLRERIEEARADAALWSKELPPHDFDVADANHWFSVETGQNVQVCKKLSGDWSLGIDPQKAALTRREPIKAKNGEVLLEGDGKAMVVSLDRDDGRILVIDGGTFLLNLPMVEPARWPLAKRSLAWACDDLEPDFETVPPRRSRRRVAFVEGGFVLAKGSGAPTIFALLNVAPLGRIAAQLFALGLAACLARAPRLGRPRSPEVSDADRPVAHPEALGALLARTKQAREARSILDAYQRWRQVGPANRREPPKSTDHTRL